MEEQIIAVLREHEAGAKTADLARKHGISEATFSGADSAIGGCSFCCGSEPSGINHIYRLYREEGLAVRNRRARRKAVGTRTPILVEAKVNARWSLDFIHDQLACGRRFRIFNVVDDIMRECLMAMADTSISGFRIARELTALISKRIYKLRWRIESAFNRLKDFRRIATRYDRLARNYLASVCLAAALV